LNCPLFHESVEKTFGTRSPRNALHVSVWKKTGFAGSGSSLKKQRGVSRNFEDVGRRKEQKTK